MFKFINGKFVYQPNGLFTNDNNNDDGGGGGGGNNKPNEQQKEPEWKKEFGDNFDPERAWNTIKTQRTAEATAKKERDDLAKRLKTIEDGQLSEAEKTQARLTELETENAKLKKGESERAHRSTVSEVAKSLGAIYPDDIYAVIADRLEVNDKGEITNAEKVVKALVETRPAMFDNSDIDQHQRNNRGNDGKTQDFNSDIRRQMMRR